MWNSIANKVWIKETWSGSETYEDISFVITRVEHGKLEGQFLKAGILIPNLGVYSGKQSTNLRFSGSYNENRAEFTLEDGRIVKGNYIYYCIKRTCFV